MNYETTRNSLLQRSDSMQIRLPESFMYTKPYKNSNAYVQDGILYIKRHVNFEEIMYSITYMVKGYDKCHYCGGKLTDRNRTLDHMYPRRWGGISIPDNLVPCCKNCNQNKKDMTYDQFLHYKKLKNQKEEYYCRCLQENLNVRKRSKFILKRKWLSAYYIQNLLRYMKFDKLQKVKSKNLAAYYRKWGQYPHPIIVSSNNWVFKGKHILNHAKGIQKKYVMAVVLENVVVLDEIPF